MAIEEDDVGVKNWSNGKFVFEIFPPEYIALDKELKTGLHPKLDFLSQFGMDDIDMKIAQIASYCEVMMDGDYSLADRVKLCGILVEKLKDKREDKQATIIVTHWPT